MMKTRFAPSAARRAGRVRPWAQRLLVAAGLLGGLLAPGWAQILIGQTAGLTGQVAASVGELNQGARLYLDAVNARGGVNGQRIELRSLDDKFDPATAASNAKQLIDQGVLALFLTRGTPHTQAIMPLLTEHKVPLVAPSTGAMVLHNPVHPWLFNVRATYQREAERVIAHLGLIGIERIAIVQVEDSFGADAALGAINGLQAAKKQAVAHVRFDRAKPEFETLLPKVHAANPQAVLFIGSGEMVSKGMRALRAAGSRAQLLTLSNNASGGFIKALGDASHGVVVSQVFPYERSASSPLIREAQKLAQAKNLSLSPAMVEGFVSAKVLVEGLRRAGPNLSRERLRQALESMSGVDLGELEISYSPRDHSGISYVDLAIIDQDGRFRR